MKPVAGLHHVTAIAGPAQENLDFYAGILGMSLVKKSVNQDDPGTYHLFYADAEGHPGTDLTFFPWAQRLARYRTPVGAIETRFGERALPLTDPHGLRVALVETAPPRARAFTPSESSPVLAEHQIRGLHGARVRERGLPQTTAFLERVMGFRPAGSENGWHRYEVAEGGSGAFLDVAEAPDQRRGMWGVGSIHHLAWRVEDEAHQLALRKEIEAASRRPTPVIDRFWFTSVYFTEPGGVLFELATEGPGFSVDEDPAHLGESLVLPPWLEPERKQIEAVLRALTPPRPAPVGGR